MGFSMLNVAVVVVVVVVFEGFISIDGAGCSTWITGSFLEDDDRSLFIFIVLFELL